MVTFKLPVNKQNYFTYFLYVKHFMHMSVLTENKGELNHRIWHLWAKIWRCFWMAESELCNFRLICHHSSFRIN